MGERVRVKLLRPLNGEAIGSESEYDKADADRLEASGAVEVLGPAKKKAEGAAPENKMEDGAAENKAETVTTATTRKRGK